MLKPELRLYLFFATENSRVLILRQGPTRQFRLIHWDRDTDEFQDGQWIKKKVYPRGCSLSPDGRHFLYSLLDGQWGSVTEGEYMAISHPPYFTALALFPGAASGQFLDNKNYIINSDFDSHDIIGRDDGLTRVFKCEPTEKNKLGLRLINGSRAALPRATRQKLLEPQTTTTPMDKYDTMAGKLYRRHGGKMTLIRDFTDMEFEPIRAPYDIRPEETANKPKENRPWHPLDQEE